MDKPVIKVIYAGIKGNTQGLTKVKIPANKLASTGKFPNCCIMKVLPQAFFV